MKKYRVQGNPNNMNEKGTKTNQFVPFLYRNISFTYVLTKTSESHNVKYFFIYHNCQAQPQAPAQTQRGLRLALSSIYPATPTPTRESIFQTQIDLDLKSKVVGHNG